MPVFLESLLIDLRYALRAIARMPLVAAVTIVSLGAGIGVNTVVFSWIEAVVLKPIPGVADASAYYLVEPRTGNGLYPGMSWLEYRDVRERVRSFRELIAYRATPLYVGEPGEVDRAYGMFVSGNYFDGLGLRPALGRFFRAGGSRHARCGTGGGDLPRLLAEPARGIAGRHLPERCA